MGDEATGCWLPVTCSGYQSQEFKDLGFSF